MHVWSKIGATISLICLIPLTASIPCFIATKLAPNTDVSTLDYVFEFQYMTTVFKYDINLDLDILVSLSPAWLLFTEIVNQFIYLLVQGCQVE